MNLRLGDFAVTILLCPVSYGWAVQKWRYKHESSWRHGTAYLGRVKVIW